MIKVNDDGNLTGDISHSNVQIFQYRLKQIKFLLSHSHSSSLATKILFYLYAQDIVIMLQRQSLLIYAIIIFWNLIINVAQFVIIINNIIIASGGWIFLISKNKKSIREISTKLISRRCIDYYLCFSLSFFFFIR